MGKNESYAGSRFSDFSNATVQTRRQWVNVIKRMSENNCLPEILWPVNYHLK